MPERIRILSMLSPIGAGSEARRDLAILIGKAVQTVP